MKRVTVEDIAKQVGVTKGLVSRALTNKSNVSEKMRDEIKRCAVSMGYDFSKLKSDKKLNKRCLLIMSSNMMLKETYWRPIITAITSQLDFEHINLDYFIYDLENISLEDISRLAKENTDAYIFMHNNPPLLLNAVVSLKKIVVVIDPKCYSPKGVLEIKYSNFSSFFELVSEAVKNGHRNFLFYGPNGNIVSFNERLNGYREAINTFSNLGVTSKEILFDSEKYEDKDKLIEALNGSNISCIFSANDLIAINAIKTIESIGMKVPDDYSVVGFDNIIESEKYKLTTINVPRKELGSVAARYVIKHLKGKEIKYQSLVIDCEMVNRESLKNKEV